MYKVGKCKDCDYNGKLIAGRCQKHYWEYRSTQSKKKPQQIAKRDKKASLTTYFATQVLTAPDNCEECGNSIAYYKQQKSRIIVAHILAKRDTKYPTAATHPQNKMFYCPTCHTDFDNKGHDHIRQMRSLPEIKKRFLEVYKDLTPQEQRKAENEFNYLF